LPLQVARRRRAANIINDQAAYAYSLLVATVNDGYRSFRGHCYTRKTAAIIDSGKTAYSQMR